LSNMNTPSTLKDAGTVGSMRDDEGLQNGSQAVPKVNRGPLGRSCPDIEGVEMSIESDWDGPEI
jgi:hypothetical protein